MPILVNFPLHGWKGVDFWIEKERHPSHGGGDVVVAVPLSCNVFFLPRTQGQPIFPVVPPPRQNKRKTYPPTLPCMLAQMKHNPFCHHGSMHSWSPRIKRSFCLLSFLYLASTSLGSRPDCLPDIHVDTAKYALPITCCCPMRARRSPPRHKLFKPRGSTMRHPCRRCPHLCVVPVSTCPRIQKELSVSSDLPRCRKPTYSPAHWQAKTSPPALTLQDLQASSILPLQREWLVSTL